MPVLLAALALVLAACGSSDEAKRPAGPKVQPPPGTHPLERLGPAEDRLDLVAAPGYAEPGWVGTFETQTGCQVSVREARDPQDLAGLLRSGRFDVAAAPSDVMPELIGDGAIAPVNTALVRGYEDLLPALREAPTARAGSRVFGVPQGRWATLLAYRRDRIPGTLTKSDSVFEAPQLVPYRGLVTAPAGPAAIADAAVWLAANREEELGVTNPYELDARQLRAAVRLLRQQRQYLGTTWTTVTEAVDAFAEQDAVQGLVPQGAVLELQQRRPRLAISATLPREGTTGAVVDWVVAARARHPGCAYRWIGHAISPTVQAQASAVTGDAPSNPRACDFARDEAFCDTVHATDEEYWERVTVRTTPMRDCGDDRGQTCTTREDWLAAWRQVAAQPTG